VLVLQTVKHKKQNSIKQHYSDSETVKQLGIGELQVYEQLIYARSDTVEFMNAPRICLLRRDH